MAKAGRPKGATGHRNIMFKEAVTKLLEYAAPQMVGWLEEVAATEGPGKALGIVKDLAEFAAPKLARTEVQTLDENGAPTNNDVRITIQHVAGKNDVS